MRFRIKWNQLPHGQILCYRNMRAVFINFKLVAISNGNTEWRHQMINGADWVDASHGLLQILQVIHRLGEWKIVSVYFDFHSEIEYLPFLIQVKAQESAERRT